MSQLRVTAWAILAFLVLTVTTAYSEEPADPALDPALRDRVTRYLDATKARDYATLFRMESATVEGTMTAANAPHRAVSSELLSFEIKGMDVRDGDADVSVLGTFQLPQMKLPFTQMMTSRWVLIDGEWYHRTPSKTGPN